MNRWYNGFTNDKGESIMGFFKNMLSKLEQKVDNTVSTNNSVNSPQMAPQTIYNNLISHIENGGYYRLEESGDYLDIYKDHLIHVKKVLANYPTIVKYDSNDLPSFQLDKVVNEVNGYNNYLNIYYYPRNDSSIPSSLIVSYRQDKIEEVRIITNYLSNKILTKHEYDKQQKLMAEKEEYERLHGKHRYSKLEFPFFDDDCYLKYSYYDVDVMGVVYRDFNISDLPIDADVEFNEEPENEYDKNAIQIRCCSTPIGYVPKNKLQSMIHDYLDNNDTKIVGFISKVDEDEKKIQVAIGFYRSMSDYELKKLPYVDASLIKTTKKDDLGTSRQENLDSVNEGDIIELDYQFDTETYLVTDDVGNELGEINASKSQNLQDYENEGKELHGVIIEVGMTDSGKNACKVRVLAI